MANAKHSEQTVADGIHILQGLEYADQAAREGAIGLTAADVGKVARQTDNDTWWLLTGVTPGVTWLALGSLADTEKYNGESDGSSSTTSTTLQTKLDVTETLKGGDYRISWYCEVQADSIAEFVRINAIIDPGDPGEEVIGWFDQPITVGTTSDLPSGGFAVRTLAAGSHTFRIAWATIGGGYSAFIRRARLFIERIG